MSPLARREENCVLESICPPGVAPKRMPKAEATTGLAPKKASATSPLVVTMRLPSEGFVFEKRNPAFLW
jgi:hypothetical protein